MQNNFVQNVLSVLVPASVGNTSYYNLWNVEKQTTHANTQLCYNSLLPSVIRELNRLPQEMRDATTKANFKNKLNENNIKAPTY